MHLIGLKIHMTILGLNHLPKPANMAKMDSVSISLSLHTVTYTEGHGFKYILVEFFFSLE